MTLRAIILSISVLAALLSLAAAEGSCVFGDSRAPQTLLTTGHTRAVVSGSGIKVFPYDPSGFVLESDFILAEVLSVHELNANPPTHCIASLDQTAINLPALQKLNVSNCDCSHQPIDQVFPGTSVLQTGVRVNFTCPGFSGLSLRMDVLYVNDSISIPHQQFNSTDLTYDYYTPNTIKFNVDASNFPWIGNPATSYAALFIKSSFRSNGANLLAITETEKLSVNMTSVRSSFQEEVQRAFVLDGLSYMTPEPASTLNLSLSDATYSLLNGIALCYNKLPPGFHAQNISYDPTLAAAFFGDLGGPTDTSSPSTKKSNKIVVAIVVPIVVVVVVAVLIVLFLLGKFSSTFKNWARPYRNRDK